MYADQVLVHGSLNDSKLPIYVADMPVAGVVAASTLALLTLSTYDMGYTALQSRNCYKNPGWVLSCAFYIIHHGQPFLSICTA